MAGPGENTAAPSAGPQRLNAGAVNALLCRSVAARLVAKFSDSAPTVTVCERGVTVDADGTRVRLSHAAAAALAEELEGARRREFLATVGVHRPDGSYVVERRRADSSGHRKIFDSFGALVSLYERLPGEFTADDLTRAGLTDGRRALVLRHFAEHPAFECRLAARQPLTASKEEGE